MKIKCKCCFGDVELYSEEYQNIYFYFKNRKNNGVFCICKKCDNKYKFSDMLKHQGQFNNLNHLMMYVKCIYRKNRLKK